MKNVILFFALVLVASCANIGREFSVKHIRSIEIGKTTNDQIMKKFGTPWRMGLEDGITTWTYGQYHYSLFSDSSTKDLVIRFDDKGVVKGYNFNSTNPEDLAR